MRSRYSAFAVGDDAYLSRSWHSSTRPQCCTPTAASSGPGWRSWARSGGGLLDSEGTVEFRASWTASGRAGSLHEDSRFVREGGRWVYLTGTTPPG